MNRFHDQLRHLACSLQEIENQTRDALPGETLPGDTLPDRSSLQDVPPGETLPGDILPDIYLPESIHDRLSKATAFKQSQPASPQIKKEVER